MTDWLYILDAGTFLVSMLLTKLLLIFALSAGFIDIPNERSSHAFPTPRGGGTAIVVASLTAVTVLKLIALVDGRLFAALVGGGITVGTAGFLDDRSSLPAHVRLIVHFVAATWAVAWIPVGDVLSQFGWTSYVIPVLGIVWFLNIFNFMDGIDGIAGSEAAFICAGLALMLKIWGGNGGVSAAAMVTAFASLGFLVWNWSPARIFMGDVGSGFLGFVIAVLGLDTAHEAASRLWTVLILAGVFLADSSVTLIRRALRGESLVIAHRMHAYQRWARSMGHGKVTALVLAINCCWLLPWAAASMNWPAAAGRIAVVALAPLIVLAIFLGAGRAELRDTSENPLGER
ncbi:MAG TPA: glycosyltransferase family 4 protein [Steroidobacteraceae bacterium]|nr:glycosyltransferase family 4 protein [Steroidobacteraceae bacterium]